jgi:mannose-6-phosphate isomerase-like protein (cupin superfamily)
MRLVEHTHAGSAPNYVETLRTNDMSAGTYSIQAGGVDDQIPHREDEIYVVTAGRARIVTTDAEAHLEPGSVVFVPAGEEHRFVDITEDLTLLVLFAPPYSGR